MIFLLFYLAINVQRNEIVIDFQIN